MPKIAVERPQIGEPIPREKKLRVPKSGHRDHCSMVNRLALSAVCLTNLLSYGICAPTNPIHELPDFDEDAQEEYEGEMHYADSVGNDYRDPGAEFEPGQFVGGENYYYGTGEPSEEVPVRPFSSPLCSRQAIHPLFRW